MRLTARGLNRATLARQLLLAREPVSAVEAVHRVVALQAQEAPSPYLALWSRIADFDPAELDRAFADQAIVKAQLLRVTLHAAAADDYPSFHEAMQPTIRSARLDDRRFTTEGVSVATIEALLPDLLAYASTPRTNREMEQWLEARFGEPKPRIWWAFRQYASFVNAPTGGPWSFGPRPAYVAARDQSRPGDLAASQRYLVRRYLEGFGPATAADIAQFATILRAPVHGALQALHDELERHEGPDGAVLHDVPGGVFPDEDTPAPPRLLPMWDSTLLAHAGRARIVPPEYRTSVIRSNGDVLPTLLVDGLVAGVWRPVDGAIEATAFRRLSTAEWAGLEAEAASLVAFLAARDPAIYGRYARWWSRLPDGEVRRLGR